MSAVLFFIAAIFAIGGAVGVVTLRDPFFSVLALVVHLLSLAMLFLLLRAEFIAAAQVVVYAGAVMVLYVFVVAYVGDAHPLDRRQGSGPVGSGLRGASLLFGAALLTELFIAVLGTGLKGISSKGAGFVPGFGSPRFIGNLLLTKFLLAFEVASILLLIAAVGAVVLARRRGGIDGPDADLSPLELPRPKGTGTMAEGVAGLAFAEAHLPPSADAEKDASRPAALTGGRDPAPPSSGGGEGGW